MLKLERNTAETKIQLGLNIFGQGENNIKTGIGFFDHMLELLTVHGFLDINLTVDGDLHVDEHHTVEDTGIILGQAFKKALGDRGGIKRYASEIYPMDETLVMVALDLSGRAYYADNFVFRREKVGDFPVELLKEFFRALATNAGMTLHFNVIRNGNAHHLIEACFKGLGRTLDKALQIETRLNNKPLSTKGKLGEDE